jgi:hypothetical protein
LTLFIGIQSLTWRFYIIFAVLNLCWIPIIWLFYVETAGLSLEEIDRVFEIKHAPGANLTYGEATVRAKDGVHNERDQLHREDLVEKGGSAEFTEDTA